MATPRTPSSRTSRLALAASLALIAGCGGEPPTVDTAETIRESAKPAPKPETEPAPTPEVTPAKDAPKG
jgi:hypothetical protein